MEFVTPGDSTRKEMKSKLSNFERVEGTRPSEGILTHSRRNTRNDNDVIVQLDESKHIQEEEPSPTDGIGDILKIMLNIFVWLTLLFLASHVIILFI